MTRGAAKFDPQILKKLRASREVGGRTLSAAELAGLLKTSKARVLAYESGRSVPEPGRIRQIAQIFGVHPRELYEPARGRPEQIRDLRSYAGFTAAEIAEHLGVSRATYRDIERQGILPTRDDGTLPLRLADALRVPLSMIHRALDHHPVAAQRREAITAHLQVLFDRAHEQYQPAVVNPDEAELLEITKLLRRPVTVVCRLVNHELALYRSMLKRLQVANVNVAYAQSAKAAEEASKSGAALEAAIVERPVRAASTLVRFLAEAMTSQQWRTMVYLLEHGSAWAVVPSLDEETDQAWNGLIARGFVTEDRERQVTDGKRMNLTYEGWRRCSQQAPLYGCLYPRVAAPRARARPPWPTRRSEVAPADFRE
ncbi:helix-turn-helix domain-containing protein [Streptomyces radiopugnans]|uniref:helix-turn-helix domain-containing protein n=1 Tax=Streptomyces radiopugnans TaxID=403935 RepID=UPI003F1AB428